MHADSARLLANGDIDGVLALHRSLFGSLRMDGEGGGDGEGGEGGSGGSGSGWTPPASQADLDRLINDRLTRQKAQLTKQYEGHDDYRKKAEEFDKLTEAQKSEVQKATDAAESERQRNTALTDRLVRAEVKAIAAGEFQDPADAYAFLGDLNKYLDKSGDPDATAIEEALKEVLKNKPYLAAQSRSTDAGFGPRGSKTEPNMNDFIRQGAGRK